MYVCGRRKPSISLEQFRVKVSDKSYFLWKDNQSFYALNDWMEAIDYLTRGSRRHGIFPSEAEIREQAYKFYEEHKLSRELNNWIDAEAELNSVYEVVLRVAA